MAGAAAAMTQRGQSAGKSGNRFNSGAAVGTRGANSVPPAASPAGARNLRAVPSPPAPAAPPVSKGPRPAPVSSRKRDIATSIRKLAAQTEADHPELMTATHLRDAAKVLDSGNGHGAIRHLQTAAHGLTPQSLYRHGVTTDDGHTSARRHMYGVTRHILLIKDVQDTEAKNQTQITRLNSETSTAQSGTAAQPLVVSNPSATSTRPSGPAAMNTPRGPLPTGGARGVAGGPASPPQSVNRQWAAANTGPAVDLGWDEVLNVIELTQLRDNHGRFAGSSSVMPGSASAKAHATASAHARQTAERHAREHIAAAKAAGKRMHQHMQAAHAHVQGLDHLPPDVAKALSDYDSNVKSGVISFAGGSKFATSYPGKAGMERGTSSFLQSKLSPLHQQLSWDDVLAAVELSAQTARLAVTPAPRGRPGGPGLYDVKGMGHTPYLQNIVKALIRKRGMDPGRAYAVARGAIRKWSTGGGNVHPEVRAAAAGAEAGELAKQARAKATHAHTADSWVGVLELVAQAAT